MTTDHANDETPEAPPAHEPGWYWLRVQNTNGTWGPWKPHPWENIQALCIEGWPIEWGPRIDPPDAKPPEPPPLPDGWTRERRESLNRVTYTGPGFQFIDVYDDGGVRHERTVLAMMLHAVLSHHLGFTAPVADVRALAQFVVDAHKSWVAAIGPDANGNALSDLALAVNALANALTGKGAPL